MKLPNLGLVLLAALSIIGAVVLAITNHVVPTELWSIAIVLVGAAAGVSIPSATPPTSTSSTVTTTTSAPTASSPAVFAAPAPVVPAPTSTAAAATVAPVPAPASVVRG